MPERTEPAILVVGSLNMDLVVPVPRFAAPGETVLGGDHQRHPGGKGANQAVAAARAGGRVAMVGRVGDDDFGAALVAALAADGVDARGVAALTGVPTGIALISVAPDGQNRIVVSPGANARLTPVDLDGVAFDATQVLLLQLEVPLEATLAAAARARAAGARVVLNLAPAKALAPEELADVDVLVLNETEAALLLGRDPRTVASAPTVAATALTDRVPTAVITLGAAGAAWAERGASGRPGAHGHLPGFEVQARDTTAAGDAFVGALAVELGRGATLRDAVRFANAAGALATTRSGAQPSLPSRREITALVRAGS